MAVETVQLDRPGTTDAAGMWRLVQASDALDANSSYFYLLWCRDFADTSVVARDRDGRILGFIAGFLRPAAPATLFVWQVAVDAAQRGHGLGSHMLEHLVEHGGTRITAVEATVTQDNAASAALFGSFARRRGRPVERRTLFEPRSFPDGHEAEELLRIDIGGPR